MTNLSSLLAPVLVLWAIVPSVDATGALAAEVVFSDDFNGNALDTSIWTPRVGANNGWASGELQIYTDSTDNLSVMNNEYLAITVRPAEASPDGTPNFSSARIDTADSMHIRYGTIQARIQNPDTKEGLHTSFWTLGVNGGDSWPTNGQINILDMGQGKAIDEGLANKRVSSGVVYSDNGAIVTNSGWINCEDVTTGYYLYTVDWTPEAITTYIDDTMVWTKAIDSVSCPKCQAFHQAHYLILNIAVGGGFTSSPGGDASLFGCAATSEGIVGCGENLRGPEDITAPLPATMKVDYVRVYNNGYTELTMVDRTGSSGGSVPATSPVMIDQDTGERPTTPTVPTTEATETQPTPPVSSDIFVTPVASPPVTASTPVAATTPVVTTPVAVTMPIATTPVVAPPVVATPVVATPVVAVVPTPVVVSTPVAVPTPVTVSTPVVAPVCVCLLWPCNLPVLSLVSHVTVPRIMAVCFGSLL
jgi:Glycosyl hydrolases family 16